MARCHALADGSGSFVYRGCDRRTETPSRGVNELVVLLLLSCVGVLLLFLLAWVVVLLVGWFGPDWKLARLFVW